MMIRDYASHARSLHKMAKELLGGHGVMKMTVSSGGGGGGGCGSGGSGDGGGGAAAAF